LTLIAQGIFNMFNWSRVLYYRLLGAKISYRVSIDKGTLFGEYDLIEIDSDVTLDRCVCRPFGVERNTSMYLGKIRIGARSSIGLKSFVAPGSIIPPETCIGPNSSSWEMKDATESNRDLSPTKIPKPHFIWNIITIPIQMVVRFISMLPWMGGLVGLVIQEPDASKSMISSVIKWFASPNRVGFHYLARVLGYTAGVVVYFLLAVIIKRTLDAFFGKMRPGPAKGRSEFQKFRMNLMSTLIPAGDISAVTEFFGSHYETTSMAVRALGGKVGRRVYWPGSGPSIQDFDLIDIGDNVVFGSRSHIVTSDANGSEMVKIGANSMVADRAVLLPGTTLAERVVLGSGGLTRRDHYYARETVWVGSKGGGAVCLTAPDGLHTPPSFDEKKEMREGSISSVCSSCGSKISTVEEPRVPNVEVGAIEASEAGPFGRAFYEGRANYYVLGTFAIFCYNTFTNIFICVYWNVATVSGVQVMQLIVHALPRVYQHGWWQPLVIYASMTCAVAVILFFQLIIALAIIIGAKWALMGRRKQGNYDWDKSSYCQRWQVLLTIERLRRNCYGKAGIIGMLTGTHYAVLYMRSLGATIGKDCALWAGGKPSLLFTEPDLLTIGDRVAVDDASLVSHINSRGKFDLNPLLVGDRSCLRSGSRLLSGATMGDDSCLLEHTLVMSGDIVDAGTTYQGWPADQFVHERVANVAYAD
jgi:acetyltransferase-like isoleucine patch superfamily enzyme